MNAHRLHYTFRIVKKIALILALFAATHFSLAEETSFRHISVLDTKGKQAKPC